REGRRADIGRQVEVAVDLVLTIPTPRLAECGGAGVISGRTIAHREPPARQPRDGAGTDRVGRRRFGSAVQRGARAASYHPSIQVRFAPPAVSVTSATIASATKKKAIGSWKMPLTRMITKTPTS